jgi:hypothetical protein
VKICLSQEYRLRAFENRVLRRIFEHKRQGEREGRNTLNEEGLHDKRSSPVSYILKQQALMQDLYLSKCCVRKVRIKSRA